MPDEDEPGAGADEWAAERAELEAQAIANRAPRKKPLKHPERLTPAEKKWVGLELATLEAERREAEFKELMDELYMVPAFARLVYWTTRHRRVIIMDSGHPAESGHPAGFGASQMSESGFFSWLDGG